MKSSMLSGKTALVTGSTSGIGLGIARSLAQQGANIVFNGFGDAQQIEKPKPLNTMLAPCCASERAIPRPIPEVEPVTSAVLPLNMLDFIVSSVGMMVVDDVEF